jgi:hypothetical protein
MTNMIAINDFGGNAGATVWWNLRGNIPAADLSAAWARHGLTIALPDLPSPEKKLGRAVETVKDAHTFTRPLARSGKWAIVHEEMAGDVLLHSHQLSVWIAPGKTIPEYTDWTPITQRVQEAFDAQEGIYHRDDLSLWLAEVVKRLHGTRMRERGAPYYLLPVHVETWKRMNVALGEASAGLLYTLPTLPSAEAEAAILNALSNDVANETEDFLAKLEGQGARALRNRVADLDGTLARLEAYESLLGGALEGVRKRVLDTQDQVLAAAFAAEAKALAEQAAKK